MLHVQLVLAIGRQERHEMKVGILDLVIII